MGIAEQKWACTSAVKLFMLYVMFVKAPVVGNAGALLLCEQVVQGALHVLP
jgi:hypothetical protein